MAPFRHHAFRAFLCILAIVAACCSGPAFAQSKKNNSPQPKAAPTPAPVAVDKDPDLGDADKDDPLGRLQWQIDQFGSNTADYRRHVLNEAKQHNQRLGRGTGRHGAITPQDNASAPGAGGGTGMFNPATNGGSGPVWVNIGPTNADFEQNGSTTYYQADSGRLRTILPHPTDPNTVYILSSAGGLWVTHNFDSADVTWQPLTDFLPTTAGGAAAFGRDPNTIYVGLGDPFDQITVGGSIVKTTDGGQTWSQMIELGSAISVRDVQVDTSTATDVVLVATDNGLYRSADGGQTYSQVLNPGKFVWSIVRSSAGWLAETQDCPVGARWCNASGSVYLSTDLGATWTLSATGLSNYGRGTLGVGQPGDATVYLFAALPNGTVSPGQRDLFKSTDGGLTWIALGITAKAPLNPNSNNRDMNLMHVQAWYNQMILVDPTDNTRNTVYLGGDLSTAKTTDGGATWKLISNWISGLPYVHADCHAAAFRTVGAPTVLFGTDGGIFASTDGGSTWTSTKNRTLVTHLFYTITGNPNFPNFAMGGLQDNGTRARFGQTGTFNQINGGDGFGVAMSQANQEASMVSVYNLAIRRGRSHLPPQSYTEMESSLGSRSDGGFYTPIIALPPSADPTGKLFFTYSAVSGVTNNIYFTPDGGITWYFLASTGGLNSTGTSNGLPSGAVFRDDPFDFSTSPNDQCRMAIGANTGRVFVSTDCGDNWTQVLTAGPPATVDGWAGFISNVTWADDNTLWVTSVSQAEGLQTNGKITVRVVKSTDAGATWSGASNGLPDVPVARVLVDPRDHNTVYAATHVGVYRTTDGGANWAPYGAGLPNVRVNDMYMPPDGGYLRIATYGRGIWDLGTTEFVGAAIADDGASCDHNGILGNNESGTLTVTFKNVSTMSQNALTATVSSDNPHLVFPAGNMFTIPASDGGAMVNGTIPVALQGAAGIEQANITVTFTDGSTPQPSSITFLQQFNYDITPMSSTGDGFEVADAAWTAAGPALKLGDVFNWQRRELSAVQHVFGLFASNGVSDNTLTSPVLHTGTGPVSFSFKHRYNLQASTINTTTKVAGYADGAVLEISVGGGPWTDLGPYMDTPYGGLVTASNGITYLTTGTITQSSNPMNGRAAFGGRNPNYSDYNVVDVNLGTNFPDQDIRIRFRVGTNSSSGTLGWEIDDVAFSGITNTPFSALVPHNEVCTTGLTLTSLPNPSTSGAPVTFTASIGGGVTEATGTVTLNEGDTVLGSATPDHGVATITVSSLSVGAHNLTAAFAGDSGHAASVSDIYQQVVNDFRLDSPTPVITDRSGRPATFSVPLTSIDGFAGTVNFTCSGLPSGATCSVNPITASANTTVYVPLTVNLEIATGIDKGPKKIKTMPGTYNVTLTGSSAGVTRSTTVTFSIE